MTLRSSSSVEQAGAVQDELKGGRGRSFQSEKIIGAFGTIDTAKSSAKSLRHKILTFLVIMGPGLIVMIGDNDAGGITTYAQAGQAYGYSLLWTFLLLIPILIVAQEMAARLGATTGVGHAKLIRYRLGKFWAFFSIFDLVLLNLLTVMTEFIGVEQGLAYFGIPKIVGVILAFAVLILVGLTGSFRRWERSMFFLVLTSFLVFPFMFLAHPNYASALKGTIVPSVYGGFNGSSVLFIIAIVGTTVAPWQLFFQQSNVIDKRISTKWLKYELADTAVGGILTNIAAAAVVIGAAAAFSHTKLFGTQSSALAIERDLAHYVGSAQAVLFAIILIDAALIGASAVTLSTSYALSDIFGYSHSLHNKVTQAKEFYISYVGVLLVSAIVVGLPHAPLGLINLGVQVIAGVLLPSAIMFLLILCNDSALLGPWINGRRLNIVGSLIVYILLLLSLILTITTVFPGLSLSVVMEVIGGLTITGAIFAVIYRHFVGVNVASNNQIVIDRDSWSAPSLTEAESFKWSPLTKLAMLSVRVYLVIAIVALVVKLVQLA